MADNRSNKIAELSLPEDYDPLVPFAVEVVLRDGICRAAIGGEGVDGQRLLEKAVVALRDSVDVHEADGRPVEELPTALIRAAPEVPWRCIGGAIYQVERAGFDGLMFDLGNGPPIPFDLPPNLEGVIVEAGEENIAFVKADGSILFNGVPVTSERLDSYLRLIAERAPIPMLVVKAEPEARFEAIVALLVRVRAALNRVVSDEPYLPRVAFESAWGPSENENLPRFANELK